MWVTVLQSLYFILPAYIANAMPVVACKLRLPLGVPVSVKAFGANKTYRGICVAYFGALLCLVAQRQLQGLGVFEEYQLFDYKAANIWLLGALFGFGAMLGDLIESFAKRRLGVAEGRPWPVFDQLDFVVGAIILVSPVVLPSWRHVLTILLLTPALHLGANRLAFWTGLKPVAH